MKTSGILAVAVLLCVLNVRAAVAGDSVKFSEEIYRQFDNEEIKPYIKIMKGVWVPSTIAGEVGDYRITALMPVKAEYIIGLFDHKVRRQGLDERSAVILIDGVNPLNPKEKVDVEEVDTADVSQFRKYALDGLTYNATDNAGKNCVMIVVDGKEEYDFGPVKPLAIPADRDGKILGRVHVLVYAGPAMSPVPGQKVEYGKPIVKFSFTLQNDGKGDKRARADDAAKKAGDTTKTAADAAKKPAAPAKPTTPPAKSDESVRVGKPVKQ